jgi:hypothetical protein
VSPPYPNITPYMTTYSVSPMSLLYTSMSLSSLEISNTPVSSLPSSLGQYMSVPYAVNIPTTGYTAEMTMATMYTSPYANPYVTSYQAMSSEQPVTPVSPNYPSPMQSMIPPSCPASSSIDISSPGTFELWSYAPGHCDLDNKVVASSVLHLIKRLTCRSTILSWEVRRLTIS